MFPQIFMTDAVAIVETFFVMLHVMSSAPPVAVKQFFVTGTIFVVNLNVLMIFMEKLVVPGSYVEDLGFVGEAVLAI